MHKSCSGRGGRNCGNYSVEIKCYFTKHNIYSTKLWLLWIHLHSCSNIYIYKWWWILCWYFEITISFQMYSKICVSKSDCVFSFSGNFLHIFQFQTYQDFSVFWPYVTIEIQCSFWNTKIVCLSVFEYIYVRVQCKAGSTAMQSVHSSR